MSPQNDTYELRHLESCRKNLLKAKAEELQNGSSISEALEIVINYRGEGDHLKLLELLLVLLRQLAVVFALPSQSQVIQSFVDQYLAPLLQPGAKLTSLAMSNIELTLKTQQTRAAEVLSAASKLAALIATETTNSASGSQSETPTTFMTPLFSQLCRGNVSGRGRLSAISAILPYVSTEAIPSSLLDDLLVDIHVVHNASPRCCLISDLLLILSGIPASLPAPTTPLTSEQEGIILRPLLPFFSASQPQTALLHITRYLLPRLFSRVPSLYRPLLSLLGPPNVILDAWVAVASLGVSRGLARIEELPTAEINMASESDDAETRLRAFELVTGRKDYTERVLDLIKTSFKWNEGLPSAGARSVFSSATYAFFTKLHQHDTVIRRTLRKLSKQPSTPETAFETANLTASLGHTDAFHSWFLGFIDDNLWHARRYPVARVLLALNLLGRYLDVFGEDDGVQEKVYTQQRVESLLACQASEFTEVRSRARKILDVAKVDLPGYEDLSTTASQLLLRSALTSLNHPRRTQADAGKAALCVLFGRLVKRGSEKESLEFVRGLVEELEKAVSLVEGDLVKIEQCPLHGLLGALSDILHCLNLNHHRQQQTWSPIFHDLFLVVGRIWAATRAVISLAPSKLVSVDEEAQKGDSRPDHEIARAYEVLGGGDEGDDEEGMDHTGLLSGCWRATMTAGELLATLIIMPLAHGGSSQEVWSLDELNLAGETFLTWLHEIRHRGTFSKLATAFAQLVEAVRNVEEMEGLCGDWLEQELIAVSSDQHSTTRRSAALPYSILSIVSNSEILVERSVTALLEFARVDNKDTSNVTKVHALNVVKIILLDARQTKWFSLWFERGVITALRAFESSDWNVRNVGLILFSTLVHRCLAPPRGGQDYYRSRSSLASRKSYNIFHTDYPLVLPFIAEYLASGTGTEGYAGNKHTPLFPILIIVRSLKWSEKNTELPERLSKVVEPYLSSKEQQVRQAASQALASTLTASGALERLLSNPTSQTTTLNATHGHLLLLRQLICNFIDWNSVDESSKTAAEKVLLEFVQKHVPGECPSITAEVIACVEGYLDCTKPVASGEGSVADELVKRAKQYVDHPPTNFIPAEEFRLGACVKALINHSPSPSTILSLFGPSSSETSNLTVLEHLGGLPSTHTPQLLDHLLTLAVTDVAGEGVQEKSLDALAEIEWDRDLLESWKKQSSGFRSVCVALDGVVTRSKCVPVREAGLVAFGWALREMLSEDSNDEEALGFYGKLSEYILRSSHEDESQPSRFVAYRAMSQLTPFLTSLPCLSLHQALVRLVQDDDEEIRQGAASIMTAAFGSVQSVVQHKAVAMWYDWAAQYLSTVSKTSQEYQQWVKWLEVLSADRKSLEQDLQVVRGEDVADVLFEIEPPNIFRDSLVDASNASRTLALLAAHGSTNGLSAELSTLKVQSNATTLGDDLSPPQSLTITSNYKSTTSSPSRGTPQTTAMSPSDQTPDKATQSDLSSRRMPFDDLLVGGECSPIDDVWEARKNIVRRSELAGCHC